MGKLISVIMGIYNCGQYLEEALNCIVNQTYTDWEVILCDDGSKDNTYEVAQRFVENYPGKFRLYQNEQNMGLNYTLNRCLSEAKGEYIARMDGDDICSPDRFQKEVDVLENNPDIAIVGTEMEFFDDDGIFGRTKNVLAPTNRTFMNKTPFCHATCMVRKEAYDAVGGYSVDKKLLRVEDYHLWGKMYAKGYKGVNIPEALYMMRDDRNAQARRKFKYRINAAYATVLVTKMLKLPPYTLFYIAMVLIKGLLPGFIYRILHRRNLANLSK